MVFEFFKYAPLMRCRHCHFPHGEITLLGDTSTKFLCRPRRFLLAHWLNS